MFRKSIRSAVVPDVKYIPHENTSLHVRKRNHKWLKLKSYKGRWSRKARRALA